MLRLHNAQDSGLNLSVDFRVYAPSVPGDLTQPLLPKPGPGRPLLLHPQPQHQLTASARLPSLPPAQEAAFRALAPVNGLPSDIEIRLQNCTVKQCVKHAQINEISKEKDFLSREKR
jgi:hypothetical protein